MEIKKFFERPEVKSAFASVGAQMGEMQSDEIVYRLGQMLRIMANNSQEFDVACQINISWVGDLLLNAVNNAAVPYTPAAIDSLTAFVYRFLTEYDISVKNDLTMEVRQFISLTDHRLSSMSVEAKQHIEYAQGKMSISILKNILNNNEFGTFRDMPSYSAKINEAYNEWDNRLTANSDKSDKLAEAFQQHSTAFNFVGLQQGFKDLETTVLEELKWAQRGLFAFGILVLIPGIYDLIFALVLHQDFQKLSLYTLVAAGVGTFTVTLLFLYFFRIALRKGDSCRAQLVQIRLRMSLCRFIQSYADYAKEIREKNPDVLTKFEALIFSGIVDTTEKIPSTFDGIEQITTLIKAFKEKS